MIPFCSAEGRSVLRGVPSSFTLRSRTRAASSRLSPPSAFFSRSAVQTIRTGGQVSSFSLMSFSAATNRARGAASPRMPLSMSLIGRRFLIAPSAAPSCPPEPDSKSPDLSTSWAIWLATMIE